MSVSEYARTDLEHQMAARLRAFDEHLIEHGCAGWTCTERDGLEDAHDAAVRAWAMR